MRRVFVSDEHGDADAVIDAQTNKMLDSIALGGGPEILFTTTLRTKSMSRFTNELVTIDPAQAKILGRTPLSGIQDPHGIALDIENRVAFVAGEGNSKLATRSHRIG